MTVSSKFKIKGVIGKVNFTNKQFVIVTITQSNHDEYNTFTFKGFTKDALKSGDTVLIAGGKFSESKFGIQLDKGSLIVVNTVQQGKAKLINDEVIPHAQTVKHIDRKFELTIEQQDCIIAAQEQKDLKIKAYAGTGKTSTLVEIAKRLTGRGLYLAYNKAIQLDAIQKFPQNIDCKTAHSIAYGSMYGNINGRVENLTPLTVLRYIEIHTVNEYSPYELSFLIIKALRVFCNSGESAIDDKILSHADFEAIQNHGENKSDALNYIIKKAAEYWTKAIKEHSVVPIEHDFYLKMYQLANPNLGSKYNYILFDECQDANPVIIDIILNQRCQKICVGDEHQQIYSWRGAVNAYDKFNGESYYLSQSFRFGDQIAVLASSLLYLKKEKIGIKGDKTIQSSVITIKPRTYTHLCRTNAGLIGKVIENVKKKLHVVGGTHEVLELAQSGYALYKGESNKVKHNKIKGFKNWDALTKFKNDFEDPDVTFLVNIIDRYGDDFDKVIDQVKNARYVQEEDADIVFSTIHKAKGREWDNVVVGDDFTLFIQDDGMMELLKEHSEEFNLLYVAITRAKYKLHLEKDADKFMKRVQAYVEPIIASLPKVEIKPHLKHVIDSLNKVHDDGLPF